MREYEKSHPWLTFSLNTTKFDYTLWMLLGEAQSKCEHIAGVPLKPNVADKLHRLFLAKGALGTIAIEGSTLSLEEVQKAIDGKLVLPASKEYLGIEISNIVEACNTIGERLMTQGVPVLSVELLQEYNKMVLKDLAQNENVIPGQIRKYQVTVARYRGVPPEDCEYVLNKLCDWLNKEFIAPHGLEIAFGLLKAIITHLYIAWIHPFGDGNGRTARLVEFQLLLASGVPTPAAHLLSNFYNETRSEYYRQLEAASQTGGDVIPFIRYAVSGFIEEIRTQLKVIREQVWTVTWENYIHERFKDKNRPSDIRQKHLVLDISNRDKPVPISQITSVSPRIAAHYAKKTAPVLLRDIEILKKMELIEKVDQSIRATKDKILSFLPSRIPTIARIEL